MTFDELVSITGILRVFVSLYLIDIEGLPRDEIEDG
jgi:hypothetical protein